MLGPRPDPPHCSSLVPPEEAVSHGNHCQGESDADADIEDTDCRFTHKHTLQEPGGLQRISSRRRKRPRVTRQDTTESEDDGGRSQRAPPRWSLRLSPHRTPLVIGRPSPKAQTTSSSSSPEASRGFRQAISLDLSPTWFPPPPAFRNAVPWRSNMIPLVSPTTLPECTGRGLTKDFK
ncbi:hypothetical protein NHX12_014020, partial [Muraenolepis orangiensis]